MRPTGPGSLALTGLTIAKLWCAGALLRTNADGKADRAIGLLPRGRIARLLKDLETA